MKRKYISYLLAAIMFIITMVLGHYFGIIGAFVPFALFAYYLGLGIGENTSYGRPGLPKYENPPKTPKKEEK